MTDRIALTPEQRHALDSEIQDHGSLPADDRERLRQIARTPEELDFVNHVIQRITRVDELWEEASEPDPGRRRALRLSRLW